MKIRKSLNQLRKTYLIQILILQQLSTTIFNLQQIYQNHIKHVAYKNHTCQAVSNHIRKTKLNQQKEYDVGEVCICREYTKIQCGTFNGNFECEIIGV